MTSIYNRHPNKKTRQRLRNNQTKAERLLWAHLRDRQLHGIKFRRQYGIGRYVVDFYCAELKLAIEIDGAIHEQEDAKAYDRLRQRDIESLNIQVLRFTNEDVYVRLDWVLEVVWDVVRTPS